MKKYQFKYHLTKKSSLTSIAKAARALGYEMTMEKKGFRFGWWKDTQGDFTQGALTGRLYCQHFALDQNVPEWLNEQLEEHELMAPKDLEL